MGLDVPSVSRRGALLLLGAASLSARAAEPVAAGTPTEVRSEPVRGGAVLTLVSRHLQWTDAEPGIDAAHAAGFGGIAWTVRRGAHIEPENVEKELPRIVGLTRAAGLATPMVITGINSAQAPHIEPILRTMSALGIRRYRAVAPRYDYSRDIEPQLAAFRSTLIELAKLNERFGTTAMFHTHSYANTIGGSAWDLWMLLKDIDPRYVGINYDIGHVTAKGGAGWRESSMAAHRHIHAISVKDFHWTKRADAPAGEWPWYTEFVPPGQGMVNFADFFRYFGALRFAGPIETYCEYKVRMPGVAAPIDMLGTDYRKWQLEMKPDEYIALMKRDADFYKAELARAQFMLAS